MSDPILARQLQAMAFLLVGIALVGLALYLRLRILIGRRPGGVDTWYYLASARALRRQKRLPISLPQYLFHDAQESYPAIFPIFLALLPQQWLEKYFWVVSPIIDAVHLLLLCLLSFRLTDSVLAAAVAGLIYAVTPQLISETRNLNGRAFASLLQTLAMVTLLRTAIPGTGPSLSFGSDEQLWLSGIALVLIALLYNTHTSTTIAFVVSTFVLSVVLENPRFVLFGLAGLPLAIVLSGGYYLHVIRNHMHAARFWLRNVGYTRAHQVEDSHVLANGRMQGSSGLYASSRRSRLGLGLRVLGENPFILPMLVTPVPQSIWALHMYWWAAAILVWSVLTTFGGPLRILGPGFHYMKASVFPAAYSLAVVVNIQEGLASPVGVALIVAFIGSFGALAYFYRVMALRQTEHTAQTPPDLAAAAEFLRDQPGSAVLVLPTMYADFVSFSSGKAVVWGGHSGDLGKLEEFFPVIRKPIDYFLQRYEVTHVLLDTAYTNPQRLHVDGCLLELGRFGAIAVYAVESHVHASPARAGA